jgi:hypothetical protein
VHTLAAVVCLNKQLTAHLVPLFCPIMQYRSMKGTLIYNLLQVVHHGGIPWLSAALAWTSPARVVQVMDARPAGRWRGEAPEPRPGLPSGHIPRSKNLPFLDVLEEGRYGSSAVRRTASRPRSVPVRPQGGCALLAVHRVFYSFAWRGRAGGEGGRAAVAAYAGRQLAACCMLLRPPSAQRMELRSSTELQPASCFAQHLPSWLKG